MESPLEIILTTTHKPQMVAYVNSNPSCFEELVKLAMGDKQPYSWRASWLLWSCIEKNDKRIQKYLKDFIQVLPTRVDSQKRELMKILEMMEIPDELEGLLFDQCMAIWEKLDQQPSVRINAFKILVKIVGRHPELREELNFLTQDQYIESLSQGVKRSLKILLKKKTPSKK
jgi:hypothetical protein